MEKSNSCILVFLVFLTSFSNSQDYRYDDYNYDNYDEYDYNNQNPEDYTDDYSQGLNDYYDQNLFGPPNPPPLPPIPLPAPPMGKMTFSSILNMMNYSDSCTFFHITGRQFLIAGGVSGAPNQMTEVVELVKTTSTPSFGQLPSARIGAVGTMFGNAPIICSGRAPLYNYLDTCISYQDSKWIQSNSMVEGREHAAGVKINSTTFWILGGFNQATLGPIKSYMDSTEFIIQGKTNGVPGPKLHYGLRAPCAVKLSEKEIFVIGGLSKEKNYTKEVWIYDPQNGFASNQGPSLTKARMFHSCSTMKDGNKTLIVVAGGHYGEYLDSVEIYDPTDKTWHSGKSPNFIRTIGRHLDNLMKWLVRLGSIK